MTQQSMQILVAGPYRSGTNDDPVLIAQNVSAMTDVAIKLYDMGHLPVLGEWVALPLIEAAGSKQTGDAVFNDLFHPVAIRLLEHCDGVLRIGGASAGADEMMNYGQRLEKQLFYDLSEIPFLNE
jgi:hypothetical protein